MAFAPCLAFAQLDPPPDVDQALRGRATEFLQGFVDRQFRKLLPLVAEDTQDEFFGMGKTELKSFKIDSVVYNADYTKATVKSSVVKIWRWEGNVLYPQVPLETTWKIENGKWVWYHELANDTMVTPMGPSDLSKIMQKADNGTLPQLPKISQGVIDASALTLMQQSTLDKSEVVLKSDQPSSDNVVVRNGARGRVSLSVVGLPAIEGLKTSFDKTDVDANGTSLLHVEYNPPAGATTPPGPLKFSVLVSPFNQQMVVQVVFAPSRK
jgi:hypothetical protein